MNAWSAVAELRKPDEMDDDIAAMRGAEPVAYGAVKIIRKDGLAASVDWRRLPAKAEMIEFLRAAPARFDDLRLKRHGDKITGSTMRKTRLIFARIFSSNAPGVGPACYISQAE